DDCGRQRAQIGQVVGDEVLDAVVVQPDGVEHARGRLDGARRGVAGARLAGDGLGDDAAQAREVEGAGHLTGVAEGARGDEDGVGEAQPAEGDGEVGHSTPPGAPLPSAAGASGGGGRKSRTTHRKPGTTSSPSSGWPSRTLAIVPSLRWTVTTRVTELITQ